MNDKNKKNNEDQKGQSGGMAEGQVSNQDENFSDDQSSGKEDYQEDKSDGGM